MLGFVLEKDTRLIRERTNSNDTYIQESLNGLFTCIHASRFVYFDTSKILITYRRSVSLNDGSRLRSYLDRKGASPETNSFLVLLPLQWLLLHC